MPDDAAGRDGELDRVAAEVRVLAERLGFGERRSAVLALLVAHPELDVPDWEGRQQADFGRNGSVKGVVNAAPRELRPARARQVA